MVRTAFRTECARLVEVLADLDQSQLDLPTGCPPWNVRQLLAHVRTGAGRLSGMLAQPAPLRAEVDAAGYYGAAKFTPAVDAARIEDACRSAEALPGGRALAAEFDRTWRTADDAVAAQPPGRVVRTRHGDAMAVDEFLVTRVVEVGVHGLDLAGALAREPWLTDPAAEVIADLLLDGGGPVPAELGWDRRMVIVKATGRVPLTEEERAVADRRSFRWLSFG